jgi:hypothetical protein
MLVVPSNVLIDERPIDYAFVDPTLATVRVELDPIHSDTITDSRKNLRHHGPCHGRYIPKTNLNPVTNLNHVFPFVLRVLYQTFPAVSTPLLGGEVFHVDGVVDCSDHPCHVYASESVVSDHGIEHVVRSVMVTINAKPYLFGVLGDILSDGSRLGIAHVLSFSLISTLYSRFFRLQEKSKDFSVKRF